MALRVPGRLRPRIFSTFGTTRVVGRQPNAPAAFTPGEIPGTHFQRLSRPQGTSFCRKEPRKKYQVTPPGIDPGTVRVVAQRLNHYGTPGPQTFKSSPRKSLDYHNDGNSKLLWNNGNCLPINRPLNLYQLCINSTRSTEVYCSPGSQPNTRSDILTFRK